MRDIRKTFPGGVVASDGVSFEVAAGEVHALLGENGAGKSTLMKLLYGVYKPDGGSIEINGLASHIRSPRDARRLGIGMVFQNFMLIPALTVVENVALALEQAGLRLERGAIRRQIQDACQKYGFNVQPEAKVWQLEMGDRQKVEIIKPILCRARLLIFDEPTSVLTPIEVDGLFEIFKNLTADGLSVVFITHKMREVMACADRITVLRKGRAVASFPKQGATETSLIHAIVGENDNDFDEHRLPGAAIGEPVIALRAISAPDDRGGRGVREVSLEIRAGEILGFAGISGNGQKELGEVALGQRRSSHGKLVFKGREVTNWSAAGARSNGLAVIPEDPITMAAAPAMTVIENLALGVIEKRAGWRPPNWAAARARAHWMVERFQLRMPRLDVRAETLSGGNLQRLIIGREMSQQPTVLFAYYPSRGLDVHATHIAHQVLRDARDAGAAVALISEDLDELFTLADRIAVMYHGAVAGIVQPETSSPAEVGRLMTGLGAAQPLEVVA